METPTSLEGPLKHRPRHCACTTCTQSPVKALSSGRTYSYCIYARVGAGSPASVSTKINVINSATSVTLFNTTVTLTSTFQKLCLNNVQIVKGSAGTSSGGGGTSVANCFFTLPLGAAVAVYHLDDASLRYF